MNVQLDQVGLEYWPIVEPYLQQAIDATATDWSLDDIRAEAEASRMMLWAIYDHDHPLPLLGAGATSVKVVRGERIAVIQHIAGRDLERWLVPALSKFEALAVLNSCTRIECGGRMGWSRKLPGYRPVRIVLEKAL